MTGPADPRDSVAPEAPASRAVDGLAAARLALGSERTAESRMAFLARASMALGTSLDSGATVENVARIAVPDLADICMIDLVVPGRGQRRAAVVHRDPEREPRLRRLLGQTELEPQSPQRLALDSGQAQIGTAAEPDALPWSADGDEGRLMRVFGVRSFLVLPLRSRGQTLGVATLLSTGPRPYAADEFATAGEFVRRAAVALDNALLYEAAVEARAAAETAREQFQLLVNGLRESEDKYRTLFVESRDAIYITGRDGRFIDVNPAALELFGYDRAELLRMNARDLYADPADRERFRVEIENQGSVRDFELPLLTRSGKRHCLLTSVVRRGPDGRITGYQGIIHDITERTLAERRLMDSEHFTRTIISSVRQGIIVFDSELRYQVWNGFMEEITGIAADRMLGTRATNLFPGLADFGFHEVLERALGGETVHAADTSYELAETGRGGWVSCVFSPHVSPGGEAMGVVAIIHDITERKQAEDQLVHNAFHDALTGLPNRSLFVDRLERLMTHRARHPEYMFGVAFLDLDRFKVVNDSLGHLIGDQLLIAIARRLEKCVRQGDTVARLGGDEFAVLLDDVQDLRDATRVAERILMELTVPFPLGGQEIFTAASIGIALSSTGYHAPEDILRDADTAMYRAKLQGRSRYEVFDRNMHDRAVNTLQTETDLRRALDRSEFRLHYQPIISLEDGRIRGFEALIRWEHPRRGLIPPDDFIPLAEETGLIVSIGWWVLEEACRQMRIWLDQFPDRTGMTMSVNISTKQFIQPDLLQQVDSALSRTDLPPRALKLEITESAVVQHEEAVTSSLGALRARGIQLCIDDFGTGYSSLSYLHSFPVDTIKIDRSFISQIGLTDSRPRLVETIITLSRNLGMESVAEGVETLEQLEFLRTLSPHFVQGFLFSSAQEPEAIEQLLRENPVW